MQTLRPPLFSTLMQVEMGLVQYCIRSRREIIAYASWSLSRSKRNYPVHKLEFLALKWTITDEFLEYLYGSHFQVYIDNIPLTYVLTMAQLDATGCRWVAALSNYAFSIIYKPGKGHKDANAYPTLSGLRQWNWTHREFRLSVKVYKPHMAKLKPFAMGLK